MYNGKNVENTTLNRDRIHSEEPFGHCRSEKYTVRNNIQQKTSFINLYHQNEFPYKNSPSFHKNFVFLLAS